MWQRFAVLALMCLVTSSVGYFAMASAPSLFAPGPMLFFAIGSWLEQFVSLGRYGLPWIPVLVAVTFAAFAVPLRRPVRSIPRVTFVLFSLAGILSIAFFASAWRDGVQYQGTTYTAILAAMNFVAIAALALLAVRSRRRPSEAAPILFHCALFLWLSWFAFPWLGEMM